MAENTGAAKQERPMIRVLIAVAVNADGDWASAGYGFADDRPLEGSSIAELAVDVMPTADCTVHFIEADIPLPVSETIEGRVVGSSPVGPTTSEPPPG